MFSNSRLGGGLPLRLLQLLATAQRPTAPVRRMPPRHRTTWAPAGGGRAERARRLRQIQAGTLTACNGLVPTVRDRQR